MAAGAASAAGGGKDGCLEHAHRVAGVAAFVAAERALMAAGLTALPPALVGMAVLFVAMLALEYLGGTGLADATFHVLEPGYRFLLKWAPIFFIPALVRLPLVEEARFGVGDVLRVGLFICLGSALQLALIALLASAFPVVPHAEPEKVTAATAAAAGSPPATARYPRPGRPYKRRWLAVYAAVMAVALVVGKAGLALGAAQTSFALCATLLAFVCGASMPAAVRSILHPIFVGVGGSWIALALWAAQAGPATNFYDVLLDYSSSSGAGPLLSMMLGPLVIALALMLYEHRALLRKDWQAVVGMSVLAAWAGLLGTALLARALDVPQAVGLAALPRFCTAALALPIAASLGASQPLTIFMVVMSGFLGIVISKPILSFMQVHRPRDRGLSVGAASHVLGTVTLASWGEASAVPYSALAFVLASGFTTFLTALPPVHDALLWLLAK